MRTRTGPRCRRLINVAVLVAAVACGPAGAGRVGGLEGEPSLAPKPPAKGDSKTGLTVLFTTPREAVQGQPEIAVSFSLPMKQIGKADDDPYLDGLVPFKIEPELEGEYRWMGSRTVHFAPAKPIPQATKFEATVPRGLRSLTGEVLEKSHSWTFETPPPQVVSTEPFEGERWASPDARIVLYFNQQVDPAQVSSHTNLKVAGKSVTFQVQRREEKDLKSVVVVPSKKLPLDSQISLTLDEGVVGLEGPIPMSGAYSLDFRTYGPLEVLRVSCWGDDEKTGVTECDPQERVTVELSNEVSTADLEKMVAFKPKLEDAQFDKWSAYSRYVEIVPPGHFKPGTKYTLKLSAALTDRFGQKIQGDRTVAFETNDFSPRWDLKFDGHVLEASGSRVLPVSVLNVEELNLWVKRVDREEDVVPFLEKMRSIGSTWLGADDGTVKKKLKYKKVKNRTVAARVALSDAGGRARGGLVMVRVNNADSEYDWESRVVRITDLGLTTKISGDRVLVWVTSLASGEPRADARVAIRDRYNKVLWEGQTDADGLVSVDGSKLWKNWYDLDWRDRCPYVFASTGDDFTYTSVCSVDEVSAWNFGVYHDEMAGRKELTGLVFTDRGAYRPGETVRIKSIVRYREKGRLSVPAGEKFQVKVNDGRGEEVLKRHVKVNGFGGIHLDMDLGHGASLGYYSVYLSAPGAEKSGRMNLYGSFRVEEYRAPTFKVDVEAKHGEVTRGTDAGFSASGDYLFGAPMSGATVSWYATGQSGWFHPSGWKGFVFSDHAHYSGLGWEDPHYGRSFSGEGVLDQDGSLEFGFTTDMDEMKGPVDFSVEATVTGPDHSQVTGKTRLTVHPADVYVGVNTDSTLVAVGKKVEAKAVVVDHDGNPVKGRPVKLHLIRRQYKYVQSEGLYDDTYGHFEAVDTQAGLCKVKSKDQPVGCSFKIPGPGRFILRATTTDGHKRFTASSRGIWSWGSGAVTWEDSDELVVKMHPDRELYTVGDTARILVENPFEEAEALVTVEDHSIREVYRRRFIDRAATIEVPITDDMRPNVYVSVSLVRGRVKAPPKKGGPDPGRPSVRMGYARLKVGIQDRALDVQVTPEAKKYRPGQEVDVQVQVEDQEGHGKKSEVTLFVVDEAVLMLTGYEAPDPLASFFRPRALGVASSDSRKSILVRRAFGTDKGEVGGGGWAPEADNDVRQDFKTTVLFLPDLVTDDQGRASASFTLPDGLTTYRIMAVASSLDDCFGKGRSSIQVSKPLLLKPAMPRFLRVGDTFQAGVILHDAGAGGGQVEVSAQVQGLELTGLSKWVVDLTDGGSVPVRFAFEARAPGQAVLTFRAVRGKAEDAIRLEKTVLLPTVQETVAVYGDTTDETFEGLGALTGVREDAGGLTVKMASTAMVGLDRAVEGLVRYPYGCAEQLTSRLVPMVALGELVDTFQMGVDLDEERLAETVAKLQKSQHYTGGWGFFSGASCPYPWLSAYVLWGLNEADRRGYNVDEGVLDRGAYFLERVLRDEHWCQDIPQYWYDGVGLSTKTYILWVLASMDRPMESYNEHLYENRSKLPFFSRLLLAHAIHLSGGDEDQVQELMRDVLNHVKQTPASAHLVENLGDGYQYILHSEVRSTAMALMVLLDMEPDHVLVSKMARWLMDARREDGTWGSTQNNAWALLAMTRYLKVREAQEPDFEASVTMSGEALVEAVFQGRDLAEQSRFVKMEDLLAAGPSALGFQKDGDGRLYYAASLTYARDTLPDDPLDRGFFLEREYVLLGPDGPQTLAAGPLLGEVPEGSDVLVKLTVVVTGKRHFVAVEDPLPAGLEAVNLDFSTSASQDAEMVSQLNDPWYAQPFYHTEIHDDRVLLFADDLQPGIHHYTYLARATTPGRFVVAPAGAHEMYHPEVFGRTAAGVFVVQ